MSEWLKLSREEQDTKKHEDCVKYIRGLFSLAPPCVAPADNKTARARSALARAIRQAKRGTDGYCETTQCAFRELRTLLSELRPGYEIDHIYPLSRAASQDDAMQLNRIGNLRVISRTLNRQKGNKIL